MKMFTIVALVAAINLPKPIPPNASRVAPGYRLTAHGCVIANSHSTLPPLLPPSDPRIIKQFTSRPDAYDAYHAKYEASLGHYDQAIIGYRRALQETKLSQYVADPGFRLPLSIVLYRARRVHEAKAEWRTLLEHEGKTRHGNIDPGTTSVLKGNFHNAFLEFALSPPPFNEVLFGDDGAAYNLQRGLNAAAQNKIAAAKTFLAYALECDDFQIPHLMLGIVAALQGRFTEARHQWLADLEDWDPSTMPGLTMAQDDAMHLLLRYS
jgi:hypothetical protein